MTHRQTRSRLFAGGVGILATILVLVLHAAGWLNWLELKTLDLRFVHANPIETRPDIVCVDIDNRSLRMVGRWPWPRDRQAAILRVLGECAPSAVLSDINWIEAEPKRIAWPDNHDVITDPVVADIDAEMIRYPDLELRAAIKSLGNLFLASVFDNAADSNSPAAEKPDSDLPRRIADWLDEHRPPLHTPWEWWPELYGSLTDRAIADDTRRKANMLAYLREELGRRAALRAVFTAPIQMPGAYRQGRRVSPNNLWQADVTRDMGFVVVEPDSDGVVRRQLLLAESDGRIVPQLALAVAADALGVRLDQITGEKGRLTLTPPDGSAPIVIQLDQRGRMVVPWVRPRHWTKQFTHLPAAVLWEVHNKRRMMGENERVIRDTTERVLADHTPDPDTYAKLLREYKAFERSRLHAKRTGASDAKPAGADRMSELLTRIENIERQTASSLHARLEFLQTQPYAEHEIELDTLELVFAELKKLDVPRAANEKLSGEVDKKLDGLRTRLQGKICLLSYTATALADMTPSPTAERVPGVMAHASVLNGILSRNTIRWPASATEILLILAGGLLATLATSLRPLRESAPLLVLFAAAYVGLAGWWAFHAKLYWMPLVAPLAAAALAFLGITLYQYMFIDRERRQLSAALGQYTSKAIARQVAENPELCRLAETREVTTVFTDLRGFTQISERIGAARTQNLLNVCLGCFTEVMLRHEAMINKFIGDGIFAFWNPVIYPQDDHALLACETAVDLQVALSELIEQQRLAGGDEVFAELVLRIGVATGNAIVGPCGSEQKYDYTCIGDSVNVSSRLESANKFYGTSILISGATHASVGDRFAVRQLGGVQVKGKREAVQVCELLGRTDEIDADTLAYADQFGRAVELFQQRDWAGSRSVFEQCRASRPDDHMAGYYADLCAQYAASPPPDDWNGAIALTEK